MTPNEGTAFGLMIDSLAEVFGTQISAARKLAYWHALEELTLEELRDACALAVRQETFFPMPATLRKLAGYDDSLTPAERAWVRLRNTQTRYNREALSDPLTREVFEAMGGGYILEWGFGQWPSKDEEKKRQEFLGRYREAQNARALAVGPSRTRALLQDGY
jgi:hypothetical protein